MQDFAIGLPDSDDVRQRLSELVKHWARPHELADRVNKYSNGENTVALPVKTQYEGKVVLSRMFRVAVNEKVARFKQRPEIEIIPRIGENGRLTAKAQRDASDLEDSVRAMWYWAERNANASAWLSLTKDVHKFEGGALRIERAPAAFWPSLTVEDGHDAFSRLFEDATAYKKARDDYKRQQGIPLKITHVPFRNLYPRYQGSVPVEVFESERRSIREVFANALFDTADLPEPEMKGYGGMCTVLHYSNQTHHAYYMLLPGGGSFAQSKDFPPESELATAGQLHLLHAYEHGLGQPPYVIANGSEGGWGGDWDDIIGRINALLDFNQDMDEILSQGATNLKATFWPTMVFKSSMERGSDEKGQPEFTVQPGETVKLWNDEHLEPMITPADNPLFESMVNKISQQFEYLVGSSTNYGGREAGVRTAVQQQLMTGQSEHLDSRTEDGLIGAAVDTVLMCFRHILAMDEEVFIEGTITQRNGKKVGRYLSIKPNDLRPLPMVNADVRGRRNIDQQAAIQMAIAATQDRAGPGTPLLSDETAWADLVMLESPDQEGRKIDFQNIMKAFKQSPEYLQLALEKMKVMLVKDSMPPDQPTGPIDPALAASIAGAGAQMQPPGGPAGPQIQSGPPAQGLTQGMGGGRIGGQPQPDQMPLSGAPA